MINDEEQRDHLSNKKSVIIYRTLITFSILETLTVLILLSNEIRETLDILLNYSIWVWGVLILFFVFSLLLGFLFAESYTKRTFIHEIYQKIIQIQERKFVEFLLVGIILMGLLLELYFLLPTTEYFQNNDQIMFLYETLSATLITIILLILQVLGFTAWIKNLSWKAYWSDPNLRNLTFGYIILGFTFLYWGIMLIQSPILSSIPYWFRPLRIQPFTFRLLYLLPFLLLIWWGVHLVFSATGSIVKSTILLMIFGYGFQIMFGFVAGEGFESIRLSYADRPISHTVHYGCSEMSILQSIKYYEGHYADSYRVQTKPPGYVVGHKIFGELILLLTDSNTIDECFYNYTLIGSYLFPFLATLVIIPITYLAKVLFKMKYPLLPGMIYILTPNFMIWVMVVDQVAFPFIFISVLIAMYLSIKNNSMLIAAGAGVLAYLAIFISFAMLPTLGLYFLWLAAVFVTRNNNMNFYSVVKLFSGFIVGFALMYILFYYSLNYDAYHRYQLAANHHRLIKNYTVSLRTIRNAFVNNSVELFTWIGIPIFFLVASFCVKSVTKLFNKTSELQDLFSISCVGMYIALNVLSNTHGEVQRMWLFLSPPMVIIAAAELVNRIKNDKKFVVLLLLVIQFCTAVLHYQFIRTQYF